MQSMVKQVVPLHSMEIHSGTEINLQPMEGLTLQQLDAQMRVCPHGKLMLQLLAGPADPWKEKPTLEQVLVAGLVT